MTLPADSLRGGLMTQASVLKVTANGTTTSPVLRGHWITERILGLETPPPPPTVKAVEPDIRGAVTIRQQLEKHRADAELRLLPQQDGPAGLRAGELRRDGRLPRALPRGVRERAPGPGLRPERAGVRVPLRPAGRFGRRAARRPRRSRTCASSSGCCVEDERPIARNLARQLTIFATGAPVRFSDREEIERILDAREGRPVRRAQPRPRDRPERPVPEQVGKDRR